MTALVASAPIAKSPPVGLKALNAANDAATERVTRDLIIGIGATVKAIRLTQEMTQADLADICSCNQSAIAKLESPTKPPSGLALSSLVMVARGLGKKLVVRFE